MELALGRWLLSLGLGLFLATILWTLSLIQAPMIVALTLSTTALGTIIPSLQNSGSLNTRCFLDRGRSAGPSAGPVQNG